MNLILTDETKPRSCVKDPCGICNKTVKTGQQSIICDSCEEWVHIGCNGTTKNEYEHLKNKNDLWYCQVCTIKNNLDTLPFIQCNNTELSNINHTNSMSFLESLLHVEIINETM